MSYLDSGRGTHTQTIFSTLAASAASKAYHQILPGEEGPFLSGTRGGFSFPGSVLAAHHGTRITIQTRFHLGRR